MEGEDWQMGQLDPVLEPERGGERGGAGQCGTTACMLQGGSQDPVSGCLARQVPMLPAPSWAGRAAHSQCLPHRLQGG